MADTITFEAGTTTHLTGWSVDGSVGNVISLNSSDGATAHYLVCDSGGPFTSTYLSISHSHASPVDSWNALNSVDVTDNEGWFTTFSWVGGGITFRGTTFSNVFSSSEGVGDTNAPSTSEITLDVISNASSENISSAGGNSGLDVPTNTEGFASNNGEAVLATTNGTTTEGTVPIYVEALSTLSDILFGTGTIEATLNSLATLGLMLQADSQTHVSAENNLGIDNNCFSGAQTHFESNDSVFNLFQFISHFSENSISGDAESLTEASLQISAETQFFGDAWLNFIYQTDLFIYATMATPSIDALLEPGPIPVRPKGPR